MAKVTLHGHSILTSGELPAVGSSAPDFTLVNKNLENVSLGSFPGKKKLLSIVPSLDTPVCAMSTKKFERYAHEKDNVVFLIVSADLPFAMTRFCTNEQLKNIIPLSMMRSRKFAKDYGVLIQEGALAGITARAIVVLDSNNNVLYSELVPEIAQEPDYDKALAVLN